MLEKQKQEATSIKALLFKNMKEGKEIEPSETGALLFGIIEIVLQMVYEQDDLKTVVRDIGRDFQQQLKESHDDLMEHIDKERENWISPGAQKVINILLSAISCAALAIGTFMWSRSETSVSVNSEQDREISVLKTVNDNLERRVYVLEGEQKRTK
ncbi:MAG: hypothetical protein LBE32_05645 [Burkholderiales bacterium]|nr:hypothetical protein [Burkholderiales bacterium]